MKKIFIISLIFICSISLNAGDKSNLSRNDIGVYVSKPTSSGSMQMQYAVDTVCQICYFRWANTGITQIPCSKLKMRPEWKDKITWE